MIKYSNHAKCCVSCLEIMTFTFERQVLNGELRRRVSDESRVRLRDVFELIDIFYAECDGTGYSMNFDMENDTVDVGILCYQAMIKVDSEVYFDLIRRVLSFGFSRTPYGNFVVNFKLQCTIEVVDDLSER